MTDEVQDRQHHGDSPPTPEGEPEMGPGRVVPGTLMLLVGLGLVGGLVVVILLAVLTG
ncbi:MAG: hypothetical protein ACR2NA_08460 [Solirubrobacterales bacterium]